MIRRKPNVKSIELFAGAGGLGLGAALAGFEHAAVVEWDKWACDTIRENRKRGFPLVKNWPVTECDVREYDFTLMEGRIDLVAGGPPC
jgi:DNA (cytosine-5)-methyltransferase 1